MKLLFLPLLFTLALIGEKCVCAQKPCEGKIEFNETNSQGGDGSINWNANTISSIANFKDTDNLTLNYKTTGTIEIRIESSDTSKGPYIDGIADTDTNTLVIQTNDNFKNNLEDDYKDEDVTAQLTLNYKINFTCDGELHPYPITLIVYVDDTNNHEPVFLGDEYSYTMPSPLPPKLDITGFGDAIKVEDVDYTNKEMTFEIEGNDDVKDLFQLETQKLGSKQYQPLIKLTKYYNFDNDFAFTLKATDNGDPAKSSTATISIKKDGSSSLPTSISFSKALYQFDYLEDGGTPSVKPTDDNPITITTDSPEEITIELKEGTEYFEAKLDDKSTVTFTSTGTPILANSDSVMTLELTATVGTTSTSTIIRVDLPDDKVIIVPTFNKPFYTATYKVENDQHSVSLDDGQEIGLTEAADNLDIKLAGDDHFALTKENDKWVISIVTILDDTTLAKGGEIDLTLDAIVNDGTNDHHGSGVLIVKLPEVFQPPKFDKSIYQATYKITGGDDPDTVELEEAIDVDDDATITVEGRDKFNAEKDTDGKWQIKVTENLSPEELAKGGEIGVSLVATITDKTVNPSYATLVIQLPSVSFESAFYSATYKTGDDQDTIEVTDGPIKITVADGTTVDVQLQEDSHSKYFAINYDESTQSYVISVTEKLTPEILKEIDFILTINALESDKLVASTGIVVTLPAISDTIPKFSKELYTVTYKVNEDNDTIEGDTEIIIVSPTDETVTLSFEEDNENFQINQDEIDKSKWIISVKENLDDDDIAKGGFKTYILKAAIEGSEDKFEESTLIVQLPSPKTLPKFGAPIYEGQYIIDDDNTASVLLSTKISLSSSEGIISFVGSYASNFKIDINADPQITVDTPLEKDVITKNQKILLTLQVASDDGSSTESTIIALELVPHVDYLKSLKFEQPSYEFAYTAHGTIDQKGQTMNLANVDDEAADVTLVEGTYSTNFKITKSGDSNSYNLEIETPLEQEVIDSEVDILLVVNAKADGDEEGFTTILLNLPKKESDATPRFSSSLYSGTYQLGKSTDSVKLDSYISLTGNAELALDGKYKDHFLLQKTGDDSGYEVIVNTKLEDSVLIGEADIVLTVTATVEGASAPSAEAALVIKLPKETSPAAFTSPNYEATYNRDAEPNTIDMTKSIELTGNFAKETKVELQAPDDLKDYFQITDDSPYQISLSGNIPAETLNSYHEIVLTVTGSLEGTDLKTTTTVVVKVPDAPLPPKFKQATFIASYDSEAPKVVLKDEIKTDAEDESTVEISVETPYDNNFSVSYDTDTKTFKVNVDNPLEDTSEQEIYVVLEAKTPEAVDHSTAVLIVKMPEKTENIVPTFSDFYYEADYDATNVVTLHQEIKITSDKESDTEINVVGAFNSNFNAKKDDDVWSIDVVAPLSNEILNGNNEIYVELEATLSTSPNKGRAVIVLSLPSQDLKEAPRFSKPFYTAEYTADDKLENPENIEIVSTHSKSVVVTIQDEYQKYFKLEQSDKTWTISKGDNLDDDMKKNSELRVTITAQLDGSVGDDVAVYIVTLPKTEETVGFEADVYEGSYAKDAKKGDAISTSEDIKTTDGATVTILTKEYSDNFDIACADNKCALTVKEVLPDDVLKSTGKIVLVLEASKENVADKGRATVIIDLPLEEKVEAPEFSDPAYQTKYVVVDDGTDTLNPAVKVSLRDVTDVAGITVSIDTESAKSFKIEPKTDHWELTVEHDLSSDVLQKTAVLITLTAQKEGASVSTQAVVVVELPNDNKPSSLYFEKTVYTADYDDSGKITVNDKIVLDGDTTNAEVQTDGDYKDNFAAAYNTDDGTVAITVTTPLRQDVLDNNAAILVTITATASGESASTSLVVKLPKSSGSSSLQFTSPAYLSTYNIIDGNGQVSLDDPIKIKGIDSVDGVTIIADGDYKKYFELIPEEDHWNLNVAQSLPQDVIDEISILLNLQATDDNDPNPGYSSVVIQLPKKLATTNFTFKSVVYSAEFKDNELKLDSDIEVTGDLTGVDVTLGGDYAKYFDIKQDLPKITISLNTKNDFTEVKDPVITLKLLAQREDEVTESNVAIKIPDNVEGDGSSSDEDKTGLIAAVAVLAVLLVASLVGSAVFYYLKFKRTNKYDNVDEPTHFRQSNNHNTRNKVDHPTRRPTGVIKYNLKDVDETESGEKVDTAESVDESIPSTLDTRKSVQFDTVNIDELEIEKAEDDTEDEGALDQIDEDAEEAEERRSSRV